MLSVLAFLITFSELAIVGGSYVLQSHNILYNALVYGSPFYLMMNLFNADSAFLSKGYLYIGLLLFHIVKYFIMFLAQIKDDPNMKRVMAIIFEATYLLFSAYYLI